MLGTLGGFRTSRDGLRAAEPRYARAFATFPVMKKDGLSVELEIQEERANALAMAGERLQSALQDLARADEALRMAPESEREERLAERQWCRVLASERLWYLMVQREALGVGQHEAVMRVYEVPYEVRLRAGPRPPATPERIRSR